MQKNLFEALEAVKKEESFRTFSKLLYMEKIDE